MELDGIVGDIARDVVYLLILLKGVDDGRNMLAI